MGAGRDIYDSAWCAGVCAALLMVCNGAEAACVGSSPNWTSTPDENSLKNCVMSAARGDVVHVSSGAATWTSSLTLTKGLTIQGAGRDLVTLTKSTGTFVVIAPDATAIANSEVIKMSGLTLDGANGASTLVQVSGAGPTSTKPFKSLVFIDNRLKNPSQSDSTAIYQTGQVRGVVANNIFERPRIVLRCFGGDTKGEFTNPAYFPTSFGSSDSMTYEDNTIQWSTPGSANGFAGWVECGQGGRLVFRYNTWNFANASGQDENWDVHGFQNWSNGSGGQTGTMSVEYYGNTITSKLGYRVLFHRGGRGLFFNNAVSGTGNGYVVANYDQGCQANIDPAWGSATNEGISPPFVQVNQTFFWNNLHNGTAAQMDVWGAGSGINSVCPPVENKHFWNQNPSCTSSACTAGIGAGTSVPSGACTVGTAFWVAPTPTSTTSPAATQGGRLYRCTAANTWSLYFQPYTYPHPLRGGVPKNAAPASPEGLRVL